MKTLCLFLALACASASAADLDMFIESPIGRPVASPKLGWKFVGDGWSTAARRSARKAMAGIPESPSGWILLYWVFPTTQETNQLLLYPQYKSLLFLVVDNRNDEVFEADFFINRKRSHLGEIQRLIAKMRASISL